MILIADSGSSKTDWRMIRVDQTIGQATTKGFNPFYQPPAFFQAEVAGALVPLVDEGVSDIYYYGTGCSSPQNRETIETVLKMVFPQATVEVNHDLLAAARALCGREQGIACILGTGSSSCLYNGNAIVSDRAGLGFILGDEGSGSYLGKKIVADVLFDRIPTHLQNKFLERIQLDRSGLLHRVYHGERPAQFLSQFTKFIFHHLKEPYCYELVYRSFVDFFEKSVMDYPRYKEVKTHFTGSVAFYFSDILRQAAADQGILVKNILQAPISGLTLYHQTHTLS
jgi:N-acetylglucosamine kinase-like BadF-type ATPase